ncbi:MAG: PHP domain-containing protein [Dehalococcoidia bacterium]
MALIRVDTHCHTTFSQDSALDPETLVARYARMGFAAVCITDHNTLEGALAVREMAPFQVIVGEEIDSSEGELIGLFLQEVVPAGMLASETAKAIHEQGGLVVAPHPFDRFRRRRIDGATLQSIAVYLDAVEVFNSRTLLWSDNERTVSWAREKGLVMTGGSDAHSAGELGAAYVDMPAFSGASEFLSSLRQGMIVGRRSSPLTRLRLRRRKGPPASPVLKVEPPPVGARPVYRDDSNHNRSAGPALP